MTRREEIEDFFRKNVENLKVIGTGPQATGLCPIHADTISSFSINLENGLWICFSCGAQGNMIRLADELEIPRKEIPGYEDSHPGRRFLPRVLADQLLAEREYLSTPVDQAGKGLVLWVYEDGVFRPKGASVVRTETNNILGKESRDHYLDQVVEIMKEQVKVEVSDTNPHASGLINLPNGMYDWGMRMLVPHSPKYRSTFRIHADYNPDAKSEVLDKFLAEVLTEDVLSLFDEVVGHLMIPDTSFQKAIMVVGSGANGKSTLLNLLERFIGEENVSGVSLQDLMRHRFKLAELQGKLVNIYADLPAAALTETDIFKIVVSGDAVTAEFKHGRPFKFRPFSRLVFSANELPPTRDNSSAFYRRWLIIPCPNRFEGKDADPRMLERLTAPEALSALLNRGLKGLRRLKSRGFFTMPESVKAAVDQYRAQNDKVFDFLKSEIQKRDGSWIEKAELYKRFKFASDWKGAAPVSAEDFNRRVQEIFAAVEVKRGTKRAWNGLAWREV